MATRDFFFFFGHRNPCVLPVAFVAISERSGVDTQQFVVAICQQWKILARAKARSGEGVALDLAVPRASLLKTFSFLLTSDTAQSEILRIKNTNNGILNFKKNKLPFTT